MGGVSADGKTLWLSGRYRSEVYAIDTRTGRLRARIPVGSGPARPVRLAAARALLPRPHGDSPLAMQATSAARSSAVGVGEAMGDHERIARHPSARRVPARANSTVDMPPWPRTTHVAAPLVVQYGE